MVEKYRCRVVERRHDQVSIHSVVLEDGTRIDDYFFHIVRENINCTI